MRDLGTLLNLLELYPYNEVININQGYACKFPAQCLMKVVAAVVMGTHLSLPFGSL